MPKLICFSLTIWFLMGSISVLFAQPTADIFDWTEFRQEILQYHPLAKQAELYRSAAESALFRAKGGFDLKSYSTFDSKYFNNKQYFQHTEAGLKLPTWYGLEVKTSYNLAQGEFLNEEETLPSRGQATLGFNWTLGQGLLIDERRADLFTARIGRLQGEAERNSVLNELMYAGGKSYWAWVVADNQVQVIQDALAQAQIRHEAIRESFVNGERSGMDTLETFILVQNRTLDLNFAKIDLQNAAIDLSTFLWDTQEQGRLPTPDERTPTLMANLNYEVFEGARLEELVTVAAVNHPNIQLYNTKISQLGVERRLKNEKRKPIVDLNYYLLGTGWEFFSTPPDNGSPGVLARDVKFGVQFSYPIPNRKARGDLQITEIKIAQNELLLRQKRQEIEAKIKQYANEVNNLAAQIQLYRQMTVNYRQLLDFESERFRFGESSVFLINTREQRWLDAQIKYLKLIGEYRKAEVGLQWATGRW